MAYLGERPLVTAIMLGQSMAAASGSVMLSLNNHTVWDTQTTPATSQSGIQIYPDGSLKTITTTGGSIDQPGEWITTSPIDITTARKYEAAYTALVAGTGPTTGNGLGVYATASSTLQWSLEVSDSVTASGTWAITIREIADNANAVSANINAVVSSLP